MLVFLLMFLQDFPTLGEMIVGAGIEIVILQATDGAIHF